MRLLSIFCYICLGLLLLPLASCANHSFTGNGNWVTQSRSVAKFDRINISGHFRLVYQDQQPHALQVSADSNLLPYVQTTVKNGELLISTKPGAQLRSSKTITLHLSSESLEQVTANGSNQIKLSGLRERWLRVNASGGDRIALEGKVDEAVYDCHGAAKIDASKLSTIDTTVKMTGAGEVVAMAKQQLDADVSGLSKVRYIGTPKVNQHIIDDATVEPLSA
jgi:hypothetical protein